MNAVIAICHFCELHGPSILFCTQAFHCTNHNPEDVLNGAQASLASCGNFNRSSILMGLRARSPTSFGNEQGMSQDPSEKISPRISTPRQTTCEACTSLQLGEPGLFSIDSESHISYISRQNPEDQELYSILRHACVRSLSCEVCPGREGPIMFGDEASGYVFSHTFFLKDSQSRGFQRWYSMICVMMDRVYLVNSWPFLLSNFKTIIDELQSKANATFKAEKAENPLADQRIHMSANLSLLNPNQFRRTRGGNQNYRSLHGLVDDKKIFTYLHRYFSWMLKASGQRYCEKFVEGPPADDLSSTDCKMKSTEMEGEGPCISSNKHLSKIISKESFRLIASHVVIGDQLIVRGKYARTVVTCLDALKELLPVGCCRMIPYSEQYQDSWKCNFLGLREKVEIPAHILSSNLYVLIDITEKTENAECTDSEVANVDAVTFRVRGNPISSLPGYLIHVLHALEDEDFTESVFKVMLQSLKGEWVKKVKVMFRFSKSGLRTSEEKDKLLSVLNAKPEDEILLKFWMTSLSRPYRTHLLTCTSQNADQRIKSHQELSNDQVFFEVP